jgi:hypothetical protein
MYPSRYVPCTHSSLSPFTQTTIRYATSIHHQIHSHNRPSKTQKHRHQYTCCPQRPIPGWSSPPIHQSTCGPYHSDTLESQDPEQSHVPCVEHVEWIERVLVGRGELIGGGEVGAHFRNMMWLWERVQRGEVGENLNSIRGCGWDR